MDLRERLRVRRHRCLVGGGTLSVGAALHATIGNTRRHHILVTGAASGIGAATARALISSTERLWCADHDVVAVQTLAAELGPGATPVALDVTDEAAWEQLEGQIRAEGGLDALVHAAGISTASALTDTSLAGWRHVLSVNLDGSFLATRTALRLMADRGGSVVLVGSASGIRPAAGAAGYSVSKAGLAMLARVAAKECRDACLPIRVNVVSPAGVRTPMWRSMPFFQDLVGEHGSEDAAFDAMEAQGGGRFVEPDEVARVVLFLVSGTAGSITGVEIPVDCGYIL